MMTYHHTFLLKSCAVHRYWFVWAMCHLLYPCICASSVCTPSYLYHVVAFYFLPYHDSIRYNQKVIAPNSISIVVNSYTILFIVFILYSLYSLYKYNTKWLYVSRLFCFLLLSLTAENPVPSDNTTRRNKLLLIISLIILSTVPITVMFILIDHHSLYLLTLITIHF